jgi:hypothetical protein
MHRSLSAVAVVVHWCRSNVVGCTHVATILHTLARFVLYTERCAGHCSVTGVTCHRMLAKVDAGEIVGTTMVRERVTLRVLLTHSLTAQLCTTAGAAK